MFFTPPHEKGSLSGGQEFLLCSVSAHLLCPPRQVSYLTSKETRPIVQLMACETTEMLTGHSLIY